MTWSRLYHYLSIISSLHAPPVLCASASGLAFLSLSKLVAALHRLFCVGFPPRIASLPHLSSSAFHAPPLPTPLPPSSPPSCPGRGREGVLLLRARRQCPGVHVPAGAQGQAQRHLQGRALREGEGQRRKYAVQCTCACALLEDAATPSSMLAVSRSLAITCTEFERHWNEGDYGPPSSSRGAVPSGTSMPSVYSISSSSIPKKF